MVNRWAVINLDIFTHGSKWKDDDEMDKIVDGNNYLDRMAKNSIKRFLYKPNL